MITTGIFKGLMAWIPRLLLPLLLTSHIAAQVKQASYYDGSIESDRSLLYNYLDQVEAEAGDAFHRIKDDHAVFVATRMGHIDRDALDSASFCDHILTAENVRERFYKKAPLTEALFKRYLLPLRIKHESTRKDWLPSLSRQFTPLTKTAKTADEAAALIFSWVKENLSLKEQEEFYLMTSAGDLDIFRVLEAKKVHEINLCIFTVSALRSVGVAARIVWAPILRGERGGKLWLEYRNEEEQWVPWMPSIRKTKQTKADVLKILEGKTGMIFVHQDNPLNVTESYLPVCEFRVQSKDPSFWSQVFLLGQQGLVAMEGHDTGGIAAGKTVKFARGGKIYLAVTKEDVSYFLTKVTLKAEQNRLDVAVIAGKPVITK